MRDQSPMHSSTTITTSYFLRVRRIALVDGAINPASPGRKAGHGNDRVWKAWKAMKPASHPSHTLWKSLRDSHIAAEQTRASIILLSQYAFAKSSSELQLRLSALEDIQEERTVFTGLSAHVEVLRQRFTQTPNNVVPMRKPPQSVREARWTHRASWVGPK